MTKKKHPRDRGERLKLREKDKEKTARDGLKRRKKEADDEVPLEVDDK